MTPAGTVSLHVWIGVPLAAFLHSGVQFAYSYGPGRDNHLWMFPVHFGLGVLVGSVILVPAYLLQGLSIRYLEDRKTPLVARMIAGAALQALLVAGWARGVGIEPSLGGNFRMEPVMLGAAFLAGALTAWLASTAGPIQRRWRPDRGAEPPPDRQPMV